MKRNKYNPSHYINSIRKRNCVKIKQIFDTGIEGIIDVLENDKHSNDTPLIKEYMKYIDYIKDNVIPNHYINSIRKRKYRRWFIDINKKAIILKEISICLNPYGNKARR